MDFFQSLGPLGNNRKSQRLLEIPVILGLEVVEILAVAGHLRILGSAPWASASPGDGLLWNSTGIGRFVPGTDPNLSQGGVPFVPDTVPVAGRRRLSLLRGYFGEGCENNLGNST